MDVPRYESISDRKGNHNVLISELVLLDSNFSNTAQKMNFSIRDFFSQCDQIPRKLRIWSHLPKKSLMENFTFCTM